MRERQKKRLLERCNYTPEELEIRETLKANKHNAKYKIIITEEHYDEKKRKHQNAATAVLGYNNGYLAYFSDYPEDGNYIDMIYFNWPWEYQRIVQLYEGEFYQLFDVATGNRIGYGSFDPDSPIEDIRETKPECCYVCEHCFWRGTLYGEIKEINNLVTCYNPIEKENWKEVYKQMTKENR